MRRPIRTRPSPPLVGAPPRGQPQVTEFEVRERVAMAYDLLLLGMTRAQVVRTLQLPPVRPGEKDKAGQLKVGGLALTQPAATRAVNRALRKAELHWEMTQGYDRVSQKLVLEAAIAGAMRDRKWAAVAGLAAQLSRITGTAEPIEVQIVPGDARKKALMNVIAQMPEDEFTQLDQEANADVPALPPH